jgi:hypothetical protein
MKCSFTSDESIRWAEDSPVGNEEQGTGDVPVSRQAVQSRSHKGVFRSHQTDMTLFQVQPSGRSNNPKDGERRWHRGNAIYKNCSCMNDEHKRQAEDPSGLDEEWGTGNVHVLWQAKHMGRYMEVFMDHQMDMTLVQVQPSIRSNTLGDRETRGCHGDAVYDKWSYMNTVSGVNDDRLRCLPEKVVNEQRMACCMPSLTNITGNSPVSQ